MLSYCYGKPCYVPHASLFAYGLLLGYGVGMMEAVGLVVGGVHTKRLGFGGFGVVLVYCVGVIMIWVYRVSVLGFPLQVQVLN